MDLYPKHDMQNWYLQYYDIHIKHQTKKITLSCRGQQITMVYIQVII